MSNPRLLLELQDKEFRDEFVQSHVRGRIAYQVQALRAQRGMTQSQFAEALGKPQSVISRLENTEYGKVSVQTLLDIAAALDIALQVRFCDFTEFTDKLNDVSPKSLQVSSYSAAPPTAASGAPYLGVRVKPAEPTMIFIDLAKMISVVTNEASARAVHNSGANEWPIPLSSKLTVPQVASGTYNTGKFTPIMLG